MSESLPPKLNPREANELVRSVAQLAGADLPLAAGLRAAAGEAAAPRMRRALRYISTAIEQGCSLQQAIASCGPQVPKYLSGFLGAAEKTGKLGIVLAEWVENQWAARIRWRAVVAAMAYPLLTLALAYLLFLFLTVAVAPVFKNIVVEFGLRVPLPTKVFFWLSDVALPLSICAIVVVLLGLGIVRLFGGSRAISQLIGALPLFGKLWFWSGSAEGLRALGLLVENQIPLPEALALAADGISDANTSQSCRQLGKRTEAGQPLWEALLRTRLLPMFIIPIIRQGEQQGTLDTSLRTAAKMLEDRVQDRSTLVIQILPPLIFFFAAFLVGMFPAAIYLPMISLIQGLS
jgi:type II secretory pathway component PulF